MKTILVQYEYNIESIFLQYCKKMQWQCLQGLEGEEDHPQASTGYHQGRRGVGHPDQGHH